MKASTAAGQRISWISMVCLALAVAGPAAAADDYGWIAGFNVGQAKLKDFRHPTTSKDDTDTVGSIYGGYQFTRYFGVGGGYVDLGKYSFQGPSFGGYSEDLKVDGFHVFAAGNLPVADRVGLVGTAGAYRWKVKFHSAPDAFDPERNQSDTGVSPTLGIGVNIDIFSKRGTYLHIGWQRFFKVGKRETTEHENDYDMFFVGILYNFSRLMEGWK